MTTIPPDNLERSLTALTDGPSETPALWSRALEQSQQPRSVRSAIGNVFRRPLPGVGIAAAVALLLIGVAVAIIPSLGKSRSATGFAAYAPHEDRGYGGASYDILKPSPEAKVAARRASAPADPEAPAAAQVAASTPAADDRQVIRRATLELESPDVSAVFAKASHAISEARGEYVQDSSLTGQGEGAQATITLRVAADRLSAAVNELRQLGTVRSENTTGEDVTSQAVDLDARLRNEQRVETELLQLMEKRSDAPLKEILELCESLSSVRQRIEQIAGQREHFSRLVNLATILVIVRPPASADPKPAAHGALWDYFTKNISAAWQTGLAFLADTLASLLKIAIGGLIWWLLAAAALYFVIRRQKQALARGV